MLRAGGRDHELADAGLGVHEAAAAVAAGRRLRVRDRRRRAPRPRHALAARAGCAAPRGVLDTGAFAWTDARLRRRRRSRTRVIYELHVGTFTPEGHVRGRDPAPARAARARRHRDRAACRSPSSPAATAGATTASTCPPRSRPTAGRAGCSSSSTPPTREGLAVLLDVVYNHVGASGDQALEAFGPYFTDAVRDVLGQGDQLRRRRLRRASASGRSQSAEGWIRDFHVDGLRLDAIHAIFDGGAEHLVAGDHRARPRDRPARARDRRERPERPARWCAAASAAAGAATPPGPTTSTTRCACC